MEEFKPLEEIFQQDERIRLLGAVSGQVISLQTVHQSLSNITLSIRVPDVLQSQFNVARNLALYSYFSGGLAAVADLQGFIVVEGALKKRFEDTGIQGFKALLDYAIDEQWIADKAFSHVEYDPNDPQAYSRDLKKLLRKRRNNAAHGDGRYLDFNCIQGL